MQFERRRDGVRYVVEAYGSDRSVLEEVRKEWPGSRVEYDAMGLLLYGPDGRPHLSGPVYILWRPASQPASPVTPPASQLASPVTPPAPQLASPLASPAPQPHAFPELEDPADFLADRPTRPFVQPQARPFSPPESHEHKNITRVDRPTRNVHGYHVRLGWRGTVYQKWFSDTTCGGREAALAAALAWRNAKECELGKPRTERLVKGHDATSNTGIIGVARVTIKGRPYFRALWRDPDGKMRRRWFSIDDLGEQQALRLAIAARKEGAALRLCAAAPWPVA